MSSIGFNKDKIVDGLNLVGKTFETSGKEVGKFFVKSIPKYSKDAWEKAKCIKDNPKLNDLGSKLKSTEKAVIGLGRVGVGVIGGSLIVSGIVVSMLGPMAGLAAGLAPGAFCPPIALLTAPIGLVVSAVASEFIGYRLGKAGEGLCKLAGIEKLPGKYQFLEQLSAKNLKKSKIAGNFGLLNLSKTAKIAKGMKAQYDSGVRVKQSDGDSREKQEHLDSLSENLKNQFSNENLKKIVDAGMKCEAGKKGKVLYLRDKYFVKREIFIRKTEDDKLGVSVLQRRAFAKGGLGKVFKSNSEISSAEVVKKKARKKEGRVSRTDIRKEYFLLNLFAEKGGDKRHVQALPFSPVTKGIFRKEIVGYYGKLYAGDCKSFPGNIDSKEALSIIRQVNDGLSFILEQGYCQPDNKLGNLFYTTNEEGEKDVAVSDLGGLININDEDLMKTFTAIKDDQAKVGFEEALEKHRNKLLTGYSPVTTCHTFPESYNNFLDLISKTPKEELKSVIVDFKELIEKHMVYSQAVVTLQLLLNPEQFMLIKNSIGDSILGLQEPDQQEKWVKVGTALKAAGLTDEQIDCIFAALKFDHTKRPNFTEFVDVMKG